MPLSETHHGVPGPAVYAEFETFKPAINPDTADIDVALAGIPIELRKAIRYVTGRLADLGVVGDALTVVPARRLLASR